MADGGVTIESPLGPWTVASDPDPTLCAPCAVTRWLRILDLVVTRPTSRDIAQALKKAKPEINGSPHLCRSPRGLDEATRVVPLLPPIDQWGYVPFPVQRLTPHSLSRRVRDLLNGDLARIGTSPSTPTMHRSHRRRRHRLLAVYRRQDVQHAWARRRADLRELAGANDDRTDIGRRADELNRRAMALIENRHSGVGAT